MVNRIERLMAYRGRRERLVLGLMSGMSQDGLDLALVRLRDGEAQGRTVAGLGVHLLAFETRPYDTSLRARIRAAVHGSTRDVNLLDYELAERWSAMVLAFLAERGIDTGAVHALASHGQTLDHVPSDPDAGRGAATLQVGEGDVLAERTGILTVSDFRPRDVAAGGDGAPLVPFAEWVLHARPGEVTASQNLGSIANVAVLPDRIDDVLAFDAGPANTLIDALVRRATGEPGAIDRDGRLSAAGRVDDAFVAAALDARRAYLDRMPPKSAGYDEFGPALATELAARVPGLGGADLVRSAVEVTALCLADQYRRFVLPRWPALTTVRVTGGGAHNPTLMASITEHLGAIGLGVERPQPAWVDGGEAVAFALLADATLRGLPSNVPGGTGARCPVPLGKISL